jgi:hypothetical protein
LVLDIEAHSRLFVVAVDTVVAADIVEVELNEIGSSHTREFHQ